MFSPLSVILFQGNSDRVFPVQVLSSVLSWQALSDGGEGGRVHPVQILSGGREGEVRTKFTDM